MSTSALTKIRSAGALVIEFVDKKLHASRFLPKVVRGFLQFNDDGELVATDSPVIAGDLKFAPSATATNITTAGAGTLTAAALDNGLITRDPNGGDRTDTTDTAANIIAGLDLDANYEERFCVIHNTADAAETITLAGGVGVTLQSAITIAQGSAVKLGIMRTGAAAVVIRAA